MSRPKKMDFYEKNSYPIWRNWICKFFSFYTTLCDMPLKMTRKMQENTYQGVYQGATEPDFSILGSFSDKIIVLVIFDKTPSQETGYFSTKKNFIFACEPILPLFCRQKLIFGAKIVPKTSNQIEFIGEIDEKKFLHIPFYFGGGQTVQLSNRSGKLLIFN